MKNVKLFQSQDRQGFLVSLDIEDLKNEKHNFHFLHEDVKENLINWLKNNHNEIFWDIEMHEGGDVNLEQSACYDTYSIVFSGDNGIFVLEEVEVEKIEL